MVAVVSLLVGLSLAGCTPSRSAKPAAPSVLSSCSRDGVSALCGTLQVRENRLVDKGRRIPIRVVVFPAAGRPSVPDPIVWLAGGPGDSAVDAISRVRPLFTAASDRDLVFIEQRGTGASKLTCPAFPGLEQKAALRAGVASCVRQLSADLASYTTAMSVDDVDEVLSDLHYNKVNLVGISYGATVEQTFLLRHPDRVRTMALLGGTLLDVPVFERFPQNGQNALDKVFAECASVTACNSAFPKLKADWAALWRSINQHPWVVPANRSPDGKQAVFNTDWLANGLHAMLTVATTQAYIPLLVHLLGATTDRVGTILAIAKAMPSDQASADGNGMLPYATRCNESWARDDPNRLIGTASFEYAFDRANAQWWQYVCSLIPPAHQAAVASQPRNATVAVLALNGVVDPQDPPANMAGARTLWPNSLALAVPGQGHDLDNHSGACDATIIASFVERGSPKHLNTTCLSGLGPPAFALTLKALSGS